MGTLSTRGGHAATFGEKGDEGTVNPVEASSAGVHLIKEALEIASNHTPGILIEGRAQPVGAESTGEVQHVNRGLDLNPPKLSLQSRTIDTGGMA